MSEPQTMSISDAELQYRRDLLRCFTYAVTDGNVEAFIEQLGDLDWPEAWHDAFREVVSLGSVHPNIQIAFTNIWTAKLVNSAPRLPDGSRLRTIFKDDLELLVGALRILLPPTRKNLPKVLYRGQSKEEFALGVTGISWSHIPILAECYARHPGWNSMPGVILATFSPAHAIIGQTDDMEWLLDPRQLIGKIHVIHAPKRLLHKDANHPDSQFELSVLNDLHGNYLELLATG